MSKAVPFLIQGKNLILVIDSKSHVISKNTHMNYEKILDALKTKKWDVLHELVEPKKTIVNFSKGYVTFDNDSVFWKGEPFNNALSTRMIEMYKEGFPIDPMILFMENLMLNPSKRSVDQLYGFLEKNNLPITEDGCFLAYKKVRRDYLDIHTGKINNSIGQIVEMERNLVDDNPDSHCSSGLHFCSEKYLGAFGTADQPVMILKINPADVVSIPKDYDGAKGRCCRYEVVGEVTNKSNMAFTASVNKEYKTKVNPQSAWPFPKSAPETVKSKIWPTPITEQLYDLVKLNGMVSHIGLHLDKAREQVQKNIRQKKAKLKIVKTGTSEEI